MADEEYDELSTKRERVRLLAKGATGEQLNAAIHACIDNRLNETERRTVLIQTIYESWYERLMKRPRPPDADFALTWEDVERIFLDVHAIVGAPRPSPQPALLDEQSHSQSRTAPMARLPVRTPEPAPPQTSCDEKSELHNISTPIARLPVGVLGHGDDFRVLEHIRRALDEPPPQPVSSEKISSVAVPIRVRSSLDWAHARWLGRESHAPTDPHTRRPDPNRRTEHTQKRPITGLILALVVAIVCVGGSLWVGLRDSSSSNLAENLGREFSRERDRASVAIGGFTVAKDSKQQQFKQALDKSDLSSKGRGRELAEAKQLPDARQVELKQALDESEKTALARARELHDTIASADKPSGAEVSTKDVGSPTGSSEGPWDDSSAASEITRSTSTPRSIGDVIAGVQASSGATRDDAKTEASGQLMRANRFQPDRPLSPPATPSGEEAKLIARAESLIKQFDFASARLLLAHACEKGSVRAAFMMAETYDWQILRSWRAYGVRGDAQKAREFYQMAAAAGIEKARERVEALQSDTKFEKRREEVERSR